MCAVSLSTALGRALVDVKLSPSAGGKPQQCGWLAS
jgi:hypothetical protein